MNAQAKTTALRTVDIAYIGLFVAVMAICSWISIPATVPFTLQTFAVFMAVGLLGGKRGTIAVLTYVLLGAIGVPVFAGFSGGIGALLGNSGGYIVGFIFSAPRYVGYHSKIWRKDMGIRSFYGIRSDCMLCFWNHVVHDRLHCKYRCCRHRSRTWLVCYPVYHSGSLQDRYCFDPYQASEKTCKIIRETVRCQEAHPLGCAFLFVYSYW